MLYLTFIPILTALISFLTAIFAYLCLIYPTKPYHFLGFHIQGVLSRNFNSLAQDLWNNLKASPDFRIWLNDTIDEKIKESDLNAFIDSKLDRMVHALILHIPLAAMFLQNNLLTKVKGHAHDEIIKMIPELKNQFQDYLFSSQDLTLPIPESLTSQIFISSFEKIKLLLIPPLIYCTFFGFLAGLLIALCLYFFS